MLNDWNAEYVNKAESSWGKKRPKYTLDMFNFAIKSGTSWLDLGCGFGRFLKFLLESIEYPDYIGCDSSKHMIKRMNDLHPDYFLRVFHRDITTYIPPVKEVVVSSAVFIHLNKADQVKILNNILKMDRKPKAITFDINCLKSGRGNYSKETITKGNFLMHFQSPESMLDYLKKHFHEYSIKSKNYTVRKGIFKVVFFMNR